MLNRRHSARVVAMGLACAFIAACLPAGAATIQVKSTSGVMDADGVTPLQGNGLSSPSSDRIQVLYAGPNGAIQPPALDGMPTGDDELLKTSDAPGQYYTAVGEGFPFNPNQGKFTEDFVHGLSAGSKIYVRAWNSPNIGAGAKYGDSSLYTVTNSFPENYNFGTWLTNKEVQQLPWGGALGAITLALVLGAFVVFRLRRERTV